MNTTTVVIIGAGHAGLAVSRCLAERSIEHVILERGEVANSWRTERWDSLRLLTPNWQSRLPGFGYDGPDPDGFRDMRQTIAFIQRYADAIQAPVRTQTVVTSIRAVTEGYEVETNHGMWRASIVIIATGACNTPRVPAFAEQVPDSVCTLTPFEYRNPGQLDEGGVLVVGASATGTQIADEIHRSGRPVTLAAGEHVRVPRVYRGRDITFWMDAAGVFDEQYDDVDNLDRVRELPSFQLAGTDDRRMLDLNALTSAGVTIYGRLAGISQGRAQFSGSLPNLCALADLKMNRLLDRIDTWIAERGLGEGLPEPHRFESTRVQDAPPLGLDLRSGAIRTVIWATGFRPDYSWLHVPVLDRKSRIQHDGGITAAPGLYVIGLPFLRRRKSSLIDGAGDDARAIRDHIAAFLSKRPPQSVRAQVAVSL